MTSHISKIKSAKASSPIRKIFISPGHPFPPHEPIVGKIKTIIIAFISIATISFSGKLLFELLSIIQ